MVPYIHSAHYTRRWCGGKPRRLSFEDDPATENLEARKTNKNAGSGPSDNTDNTVLRSSSLSVAAVNISTYADNDASRDAADSKGDEEDKSRARRATWQAASVIASAQLGAEVAERRETSGGADGRSRSQHDEEADEFFDALDELEPDELERDQPMGERGKQSGEQAAGLGGKAKGVTQAANQVRLPFAIGRPWQQKRYMANLKEYSNNLKASFAAAASESAESVASSEGAEVEEKRESLLSQGRRFVKKLKLNQDLTNMEMPASFLTPFTTLQGTDEIIMVLCGADLDLSGFDSREPVERFKAMLRVYMNIQAVRASEGTRSGLSSPAQLQPMKKPINAVLGETHCVRTSNGITLLAEQVSHHPPRSCCHVGGPNLPFSYVSSYEAKPVFRGTSVQVRFVGVTHFTNEKTGETYRATAPDLWMRFFGINGGYNEFAGKMRFERVVVGAGGGSPGVASTSAREAVDFDMDEGLCIWAELHQKPRGVSGMKSRANRFEGVLYTAPIDDGNQTSRAGDKGGTSATSSTALATTPPGAVEVVRLKGHFNTEVFTSEGHLFWRAADKAANPPDVWVAPVDGITESHVVWGDLCIGIVEDRWTELNKAKRKVEKAQRKLMAELKKGNKKWEPRFFDTCSDGWRVRSGMRAALGTGGREAAATTADVSLPPANPDWHEHIAKNIFL